MFFLGVREQLLVMGPVLKPCWRQRPLYQMFVMACIGLEGEFVHIYLASLALMRVYASIQAVLLL